MLWTDCQWISQGFLSKDGSGEGGLQTNAPWPQNSLSHKIHESQISLLPALCTHTHVTHTCTHTCARARTHTLARLGTYPQRRSGLVAESTRRLRSFLSVLPMNHVDLVQGPWPMSARGSLLWARSDFQNPSCSHLGHSPAHHSSRKLSPRGRLLQPPPPVAWSPAQLRWQPGWIILISHSTLALSPFW